MKIRLSKNIIIIIIVILITKKLCRSYASDKSIKYLTEILARLSLKHSLPQFIIVNVTYIQTLIFYLSIVLK